MWRCAARFAETVSGEVRDYFFKADDGACHYSHCEDCGSVWHASALAGSRIMQSYPSMDELTEAVLPAITG